MGCVVRPPKYWPGWRSTTPPGTQRVYLQVLDLSDLEHIREIAHSVLPAATRITM